MQEPTKLFIETTPPPIPEKTGKIYGFNYLDKILSLQVGLGSKAFKSDRSGFWLGSEKFVNAPFGASMNGDFISRGIGVVANLSILESLSTQTSNGTEKFSVDAAGGTAIAIANDATATPFGNSDNFSGLIMVINDTTGDLGLFLSGSGSIAEVSDPGSDFSVTPTNAGTTNVYINSGVLTIENKTTADASYKVFSIRIKNSN